MSSLIFVNSYLGQKSPWTKVCLDNCPLDKSLLGQLVPWTIAPWTIVATPSNPFSHSFWDLNKVFLIQYGIEIQKWQNLFLVFFLPIILELFQPATFHNLNHERVYHAVVACLAIASLAFSLTVGIFYFKTKKGKQHYISLNFTQ